MINEYSNDFPFRVAPTLFKDKWKDINQKLRNKIEKWYFCFPNSTMQDSFKRQPQLFLNNERKAFKRKNYFSGYVDAYFKGGVIDRPLLDPMQEKPKLLSLNKDLKDQSFQE